jgi:hypothetical protein
MSGIRATQRTRALELGIRILMLTANDKDQIDKSRHKISHLKTKQRRAANSKSQGSPPGARTTTRLLTRSCFAIERLRLV